MRIRDFLAAHPEGIPYLLDRLAAGGLHYFTEVAILMSLGRLDPQVGHPALIEVVESERFRKELKGSALSALSWADPPVRSTVEYLQRRARPGDQVAASALSSLMYALPQYRARDPQLLQEVLMFMGEYVDQEIDRGTNKWLTVPLSALARVNREPEAGVAFLGPYLEHEAEEVRLAAIKAFSFYFAQGVPKLRTQSGEDLLLEVFQQDRSDNVRIEALRAVYGVCPDSRRTAQGLAVCERIAATALETFRSRESGYGRRVAAIQDINAIWFSLPAERVLSVLHEVAQKDPDPFIRFEAEDCIKACRELQEEEEDDER